MAWKPHISSDHMESRENNGGAWPARQVSLATARLVPLRQGEQIPQHRPAGWCRATLDSSLQVIWIFHKKLSLTSGLNKTTLTLKKNHQYFRKVLMIIFIQSCELECIDCVCIILRLKENSQSMHYGVSQLVLGQDLPDFFSSSSRVPDLHSRNSQTGMSHIPRPGQRQDCC